MRKRDSGREAPRLDAEQYGRSMSLAAATFLGAGEHLVNGGFIETMLAGEFSDRFSLSIERLPGLCRCKGLGHSSKQFKNMKSSSMMFQSFGIVNTICFKSLKQCTKGRAL